MTEQTQSKCALCAHRTVRYRFAKPVAICRKFEVTANVVGCLDFTTRRSLVAKTLHYLKSSSIK